MQRRNRLGPGARVAVLHRERIRFGAVGSSGEVVDDRLYYDVAFEGGGSPELIADVDLAPALPAEEQPDAAFVRNLATHREGMLNELVENVLEKLGQLYDEDIHLIE